MNLLTQRRMASELLKVGQNRVWFDPEALEDIEGAVTREDVIGLINEGIIQPRQKKGTSRVRANKIAYQKERRKRVGHGKRKGAKGARFPRKKKWQVTIRAIRKELASLKEEEKIDPPTYRKLYRLAKGGSFRSKGQLHHYIREQRLMQE